jgi:hypothetical protein
VIFQSNAVILLKIGKLLKRQFTFDQNLVVFMLGYQSNLPKKPVNQTIPTNLSQNTDATKKSPKKSQQEPSEETKIALWRRAGLYIIEIAVVLHTEILPLQEFQKYEKSG